MSRPRRQPAGMPVGSPDPGRQPALTGTGPGGEREEIRLDSIVWYYEA